MIVRMDVRMRKAGRTLVKDVAYLAAPGMYDWVGSSSNSPVG